MLKTKYDKESVKLSFFILKSKLQIHYIYKLYFLIFVTLFLFFSLFVIYKNRQERPNRFEVSLC